MEKKILLVVDDNIMIASILREALKSEGYRVTCVYSGEEALDHLEGQTVDRFHDANPETFHPGSLGK